MKKNLLFSMLLLFMGGSMQAQSVAEEQMDERFNDGTTLPYGWFAEGWNVKDGAVQTKASSGFNFEEMMNDENGFDISKLLESFMGGNSEFSYLLTPPVVVGEGESLVFSAKKGKKDDSSFSFGSSDSTFVVERSVYSHNQWVRMADFTVELDTIYKTFTIPASEAGEYRFRFKAAGTVLIDSVAGFHIDNEAPDIYVVEKDTRAKDIDFSLCFEDSTRTLTVINTATGTLKADITFDNEALFSSLIKSEGQEFSVAGGDSLAVDVTFNFAAGKPGKNDAVITFLPTDERVWGKSLRLMAVVTQPDVWVDDFNANAQPKGFFSEGWDFHDGIATTSGGGMAAMFGMGAPSFLMTPPLTVESTDEVLLFSAKKGSSDGGFDMGGMFGGSSSIVVEKSVYGSNKWEKVREFTEPLDSLYRTLWVGYIEPGEYRFRIIASDSIVVDSIAGFHIDNNAPDIYVLRNNTAATAVNYGMPQADSTTTFAVVNTGTGSLQGAVNLNNTSDFGVSATDFAVEASDTAYVNVTYLFDEETLGTHQGLVTFVPTTPVLIPLAYPLTAYSTYADAWTEDFEPEFIPEDEKEPRELPEGWTTTGWQVTLPSNDEGLMGMFSGMMGGGADAPKTWMATTGSDAYELVTPSLQAKKGDVLRFEAELGGGGMMAMLGSFMGGGASGQLNVFYSLDDGNNWTYYDTFVQNGFNYFVAPYSGVYKLRFTSPGASLDNFYGLRKPIEGIALSDYDDEANASVLETYNGKTVNVSYERTLSAVMQDDGSWTPRAYVVSLPYDYNIAEYYDADQARVYRLRFKEEYYKQFIFLPEDNANIMLAGRAYLVVVLKGEMNLSAAAVTLTSDVADDDLNVVNSFEDWYFEDKFTPVGKWQANFRSISDVEADAMNIYGLRDDGTWARFHSKEGAEESSLPAFRGYFDAALNDEAPASSRKNAAALPGTYRTFFQSNDQAGTSTGEHFNYENLHYEGNIPTIDEGTGILPTFRAIDADGTSHYFDLQGRMLNAKPLKGMYIENGKKLFKY